jgi:hypothetical protein
MRKYTQALVVGAAALSLGCKDNPVSVPTDAPTAEALIGQPLSRGGLATLAVGILAADRNVYVGTGSTYPIIANIWARDLVRLDASEPRYVNETLRGAPDPGSFAGGGGWAGMYVTIRAANVVLQGLNNPQSGAFSDQEIAAGQGFARTWKAIDYYRVVELRDTVGIAIQKDDPNDLVPGPLVCKTSALRYIAALLDCANTNLTTALPIGSFPFNVPSGMTAFGRDYKSISNFIKFNRGWKGKVDLYRALDHQAPTPSLLPTAITELTTALGGLTAGNVPTANFTFGLYHVFVPSGTEAAPNSYSDSRLGLNPNVEAKLQTGDTRKSKFQARSSLTVQGITLTRRFTGTAASTTNQSRPLAVLRDEELVLLRAQAYFENGDITNGLLDLNSVRTFYGLPALLPTDVATLDQRRNAILYEKRYSLFGEGVQDLVDLRAYSKLNSTYFPLAATGQPVGSTEVFNQAFPIPKAEADARKNVLTPTCT